MRNRQIVTPQVSNPSTLFTSLDETQPNSCTGRPLPLAKQDGIADHAQRERLVLENMTMVRFIARSIYARLPQHIEFEELISAGIIGLLDAIDKFDSRKQVQFKSYAQFRVRGAILDSFRISDWSPRELRRKGRAIEENIRDLTLRLGRVPNDEEIATEMAMAIDEYQLLLGELKSLEIGSLNLERNDESGEEELSYIPGPESEDPLFRCMQGEMRDRLVTAIDTLPEKERLVLTLYYYEELTMKEIGQIINVVESRVSQIRASAVLRLRSALKAGEPNRSESRPRVKQN